MTDVYAKVVKLISEIMGIPGSEVSPESTFVELGLDSLSLIEFAVIVNEEFGVDVEDLSPDSTLGEAVAAIESRSAAETPR